MCHAQRRRLRRVPGNRPAAPRDWSEAYLNGTSQGEPVLSLSKEHPRTPGRTAMSAVPVTPGRDEIPGFIVEYPAMGDVVRSKEKKYYHAVYLQRANDSRKKKEPNRRFLLQ